MKSKGNRSGSTRRRVRIRRDIHKGNNVISLLHRSYKRAYNRAYDEAYDRAYNRAYNDAYEKLLKKTRKKNKKSKLKRLNVNKSKVQKKSRGKQQRNKF